MCVTVDTVALFSTAMAKMKDFFSVAVMKFSHPGVGTCVTERKKMERVVLAGLNGDACL